jgi:hypothetical protein
VSHSGAFRTTIVATGINTATIRAMSTTLFLSAAEEDP